MRTRPLALIAKVLGRKYDVTVTITGQTASTSGKEINIPVVSGPYAEALAHGYIDHEAAHVRYTDFSVTLTPDFSGALLNILEDVRIEQAICREYPGCITNLKELTRLLASREDAFKPDPNHPSQGILAWILANTYVSVLGHDSLQATRDSHEPLARRALGSSFDQIARLLDQAGSLTSTRDAERLRDELMKLINSAARQKPPAGKPEQNAGTPAGNEHTDGSRNGEADGKSGKDGKDSANQSAPSWSDDIKQGKGSPGQPSGIGSSSSEARQEEIACKARAEVLSGHHAGAYGDVGEKIAEMLSQRAMECTFDGRDVHEPRLPTAKQHQHTGGFSDLTAIRTHTAALRARIQGLVQASKLKRSAPSSVGHQLDSRVLSRLRVGDIRIFSRKDQKRAVNTAVCMLLDSSGSMGRASEDHKMGVASRACFVAAEALYAIPGVTTSIATFKGYDDTVYSMVGFGEKPDHNRFNIGGSGGTCLGHALWWAWGELSLRQETRRICIAFTDGETSDAEVTQTAIKRMNECGIEVIGIGIQDIAIRHYLPGNHRIIKKLEQFTPALLDLLREKLVVSKGE